MNENNKWHFTAGTPPRVILMVLGFSMLTYSINNLLIATEPIIFIRSILLFAAGCLLFILREHVSNGDYFKEFKKSMNEDSFKKEIAEYIKDKYILQFTTEEPEEPDNTDDVDEGKRPVVRDDWMFR